MFTNHFSSMDTVVYANETAAEIEILELGLSVTLPLLSCINTQSASFVQSRSASRSVPPFNGSTTSKYQKHPNSPLGKESSNCTELSAGNWPDTMDT